MLTKVAFEWTGCRALKRSICSGSACWQNQRCACVLPICLRHRRLGVGTALRRGCVAESLLLWGLLDSGQASLPRLSACFCRCNPAALHCSSADQAGQPATGLGPDVCLLGRLMPGLAFGWSRRSPACCSHSCPRGGGVIQLCQPYLLPLRHLLATSPVKGLIATLHMTALMPRRTHLPTAMQLQIAYGALLLALAAGVVVKEHVPGNHIAAFHSFIDQQL